MTFTRRSLPGVAFLVLTAVVGSARPAVATPVTLETNISVNTGCDPFLLVPLPGSCLSSDDPVDIELWGPLKTDLPGWTPNWTQGYGLLSHDDTYGSPGQQLSVSADSFADFGVLQVRAAAEYDLTALTDPGGYRFVAASAQFGDLLTPEDPSLLDTPGLLEVRLGVDGRLEASGTAHSFVLTAVNWDTSLSPNSQQFFIFDSGSVTDVGETLVVNIPFRWGESVGLSIWMAAAAGTARPCLPAEPCEYGLTFERQNTLGAGSAEFFNTLAITGLIPYDYLGNPVLNATFGSASGQRYTIEGVDAVPEPGSLLLLGTGLAMGIRRLRRRIV